MKPAARAKNAAEYTGANSVVAALVRNEKRSSPVD